MSDFSPVERAKAVEFAGRCIAEAAIKEAGGAAQLVSFPLSAVVTMTGLSRETICRRMPVIRDGGKQMVTLASIIAWQAKNTKQPALR